jgi:hypothetical protein
MKRASKGSPRGRAERQPRLFQERVIFLMRKDRPEPVIRVCFLPELLRSGWLRALPVRIFTSAENR